METAVVVRAGNGDVMSPMGFQRIRVVQADDALVGIIDDDDFVALADAFFGALRVLRVLEAAAAIAYPAGDLRFRGLVFGQCKRSQTCHCEYQRNFFHDEISPDKTETTTGEIS